MRAKGPSWQYWSRLKGDSSGTRPKGGLKPTTPLKEAGRRMEPPMSEPVASVALPQARAAPEPPDEPPTAYSGFQGLRVTPHRRECVKPAQLNSGVVVRACTMPPAARTRCATTAVSSAIRSLVSRDPPEQGWPAIGISSLIATGMPVRRRGVVAAAHVGRLGLPSRGEGLLEVGHAQRVDRRFDDLSAGDDRRHELDRREPPSP